ncbi:MAG: hypothetical protein RDO_1490 [Flavobacteriales endosymbiont of Rhyzopertha dominica]|nr:MAG: 50S ribosome-binding GTPase [Candidatus Shikimatogenerans bostrichidophilus]
MFLNNFIDNIKIYCISGNGGNGKVSFKRKNKKLGKPDGGNGGKGGDIIFYSNNNIISLLYLKYKNIYKASNGESGKNNCKTGKSGKNKIINIPIGSKIYYYIKNKKYKYYFKKNNIYKTIILGGEGGYGNNYFKNSRNQKTREYTLGKKGLKILINIKLYINVDIGIIGYPNTGKSTILSLLTNSKPKIDNYLFTTIKPNIGIYKKNYKNYIVMEIPAIIKNSYKGKGIGNYYIRYIKKYKLLLFVISSSNYKNIVLQLKILKNELLKSNIIINNKKILILLSNKIENIKEKILLKIIKFLKKKKYNYFLFFKKNIKILKNKINKYL